MFGDDLNPTVMIVLFGFGKVSDTGEGGLREVDKDKGA